MSLEIERKFRIKKLPSLHNVEGLFLSQAYLLNEKSKIVRIRIADKNAFLTIKGKTEGCTRAEYEYPIPVEEAKEIMETLCQKPFLEKKRYKIPNGPFFWELDIYEGDNKGLIVAEIELPDENTTFFKPDWLGEEISEDPRYYNSNLIQKPYTQW